MDKGKVNNMMCSAGRVPISDLNESITCKLCKGYFIDATTIIECLHTFCKSCIVRYLESNKYCPICDVQVHKTKPLLNIRPDKTIQDLVYKLVPRLYHNEIQRRKVFYDTHLDQKPTVAEQNMALQYEYILAPEETINLTLNYYGSDATPRYLRCPSAVSVLHLKKLIKAKYELTEHHKVDIFYNQDCLNPSFSLMDIAYIYSWKRKDLLDLSFKIYERRAKKPKLESYESCDILNNSINNISNNNNNWKEVQLRISENGEMSITGIEDANMLEILDATENFGKEIIINESKNLENFPKPIQVDMGLCNSEISLPINEVNKPNRCVNQEKSVKLSTDTFSTKHKQGGVDIPNIVSESTKVLKGECLFTTRKDIPELKYIGKPSMSILTTSSSVSTKSTVLSTVAFNSIVTTSLTSTVLKDSNFISADLKKSSADCLKPVVESNISKPTSQVTKVLPGNKVLNISARTLKTSAGNISEIKQNPVVHLGHVIPKSVEQSSTLNLSNSELSVIPLTGGTNCASLTSGSTTTVFSTINKSMCSTKSEDSITSFNQKMVENCIILNQSKEDLSLVTNSSKEAKPLKRKSQDDQNLEVPVKQPKPTILNHSIGLINLSSHHQLKNHSKISRNSENVLRASEVSEKIPSTSATVTINHVSVPQKSVSTEIASSKPIIINKNLSNFQITKGTCVKVARSQKVFQGCNSVNHVDKTSLNEPSTPTANISEEKHIDRVETSTKLTEVSNTSSKSTISNLHHQQSYQNSLHTPIITPSQLPHNQNITCSNSKPNTSVNSTITLQSNTVKTSQLFPTTSTSHTTLPKLQENLLLSVHLATPGQNSNNQQGQVLNISQSQIIASTNSNNPTPSQNSVSPSTASSKTVPAQILVTSLSTSISQNSNQSCSVSTALNTSVAPSIPYSTVSSILGSVPSIVKAKPNSPIGYKTLRDPPKSWNSQINSQIARANQNAKAQQLANAVLTAGAAGQGKTGDLKSVRPAKFFKGRNMPRYLGNPASGVKPMYQLHISPEKDKNTEQGHAHNVKVEKSEIKKHSIVKIDPKTLKPISEKAPETSSLSNISSGLVLNASHNNQELRITSTPGDLKINTSSVSIFNPLKLQSSPKNERKSPKSPHSPKMKVNSNNSLQGPATTSSPPTNNLSPKQHRDKTSLTFTPPNPFVPNLTSPTLNPNQFLYPAGGFPSYDPRVMAAYHNLWYSQRMAAAAAAGFVPPAIPHAFGLSMGLNAIPPTSSQHSPGISSKLASSPKTINQPSPKSNSQHTIPAVKSAQTLKKSKDSVKNEKSLETALEKITQSKAKELSNSKNLNISKDIDRLKELSVNTTLSSTHAKLAKDGVSSSNASALEKLSHNKAIEILGGRSDMTGKRSPLVHDNGERSSPARETKTLPASKGLSDKNPPVQDKNSALQGHVETSKNVAEERNENSDQTQRHIFTTQKANTQSTPKLSDLKDNKNIQECVKDSKVPIEKKTVFSKQNCEESIDTRKSDVILDNIEKNSKNQPDSSSSNQIKGSLVVKNSEKNHLLGDVQHTKCPHKEQLKETSNRLEDSTKHQTEESKEAKDKTSSDAVNKSKNDTSSSLGANDLQDCKSQNNSSGLNRTLSNKDAKKVNDNSNCDKAVDIAVEKRTKNVTNHNQEVLNSNESDKADKIVGKDSVAVKGCNSSVEKVNSVMKCEKGEGKKISSS